MTERQSRFKVRYRQESTHEGYLYAKDLAEAESKWDAGEYPVGDKVIREEPEELISIEESGE